MRMPSRKRSSFSRTTAATAARVGAKNAKTSSRLKAAAASTAPTSNRVSGHGNGLTCQAALAPSSQPGQARGLAVLLKAWQPGVHHTSIYQRDINAQILGQVRYISTCMCVQKTVSNTGPATVIRTCVRSSCVLVMLAGTHISNGRDVRIDARTLHSFGPCVLQYRTDAGVPHNKTQMARVCPVLQPQATGMDTHRQAWIGKDARVLPGCRPTPGCHHLPAHAPVLPCTSKHKRCSSLAVWAAADDSSIVPASGCTRHWVS